MIDILYNFTTHGHTKLQQSKTMDSSNGTVHAQCTCRQNKIMHYSVSHLTIIKKVNKHTDCGGTTVSMSTVGFFFGYHTKL